MKNYFFAGKRTFNSNGVIIPSQRSYVNYLSTKISRVLKYSAIRLMLEAIILSRLPMLASAITSVIYSSLSSSISTLPSGQT